MSPAAAAQSPITSQTPNPNFHFDHSLDSSTNDSNHFTFNFSCSFSAKTISEKPNHVQRKPRLVKMRKKSGLENAKSKQFDSINNNSDSNRFGEANFANASHTLDNGGSKVSKKVNFNKLDANVVTAFSKNDSCYGTSNEFDKFDNAGFGVGADKSSSISNSNVESVSSMSRHSKDNPELNLKVESDNFVSGDNKHSSKLDLNVKNVGFQFEANPGYSKLDLNLENGGFVFGANNGSSMSCSNVQSAGFGSEASNCSSKSDVEDGSFVFRGNKGCSNSNSKIKDGSFIFGADKGSSNLSSNMEHGVFVFVGNKSGLSQKTGLDEGELGCRDEKCETSKSGGRFSFCLKDCELGMNSNFDPRESAGNLGHCQPDEHKKYGHVGFVFGAKGGAYYAAEQRRLASDGSISRTDTQGESAGDKSDVEDLGSCKVSEESGTTGSWEFDDSFFIFQARKEKLSSENEQPGGKLEKETGEKLEPGLSVERKLNHEPECQNSKFSYQTNVTTSGRNNLDADRVCSFGEIPRDYFEDSSVYKLSDEMKRCNINDSESAGRSNNTKILTDNLSMNFGANFVFGISQRTFRSSTERAAINNRSARDKKSKRSKGKLGMRTRSQQKKGQDDVFRGSFQEDVKSPGCCSPMDFSPYQTTDASPSTAAAESKNNTAKEGYDVEGSDMRPEESHSMDPGNNYESYLNGEGNGNVSTSFSAQDGLSAIRRQYRKKYKLKVGKGSGRSSQGEKASVNSSSAQSSPIYYNSSWMKKAEKTLYKASEEHDKPDVVTDKACENWRIRGNHAYQAGDLSKAEELYTMGINSIPDTNVSEINVQPLLLCYSNRAATRMSLGRIREALGDCRIAATLDPSFLKVKLRAANCYLVLGEVADAKLYYNSCLESEAQVCLDRRIVVEAAEGLQKATKVAEHMRQSIELLQRRSSDAAHDALGIIGDALKISCYSEKLFKMKGEALCMLSMYDEVIQVCEQTLHITEKNFIDNHSSTVKDNKSNVASSRVWRWRLMSKSHYHLGRLELALDLIEKQEQLLSTVNESGSMTQQSSSSLAVAIRELLSYKKAGNEAFKSGRHAEAIEQYTAAISRGVDSRPFAAICFCNRAAAHQALGQIIDAIADCSLAIALDGNYPKAVSRRATLHEMIRDYEHAAYDLQRLESLLEIQSREEQSNKHDRSGGSLKELQRARNRRSSVEKKTKKGISLDLYLILGVKASDTESDIKKAYRKAALRHHPDKAAQLLPRNDVSDNGKLWKEIIEKVHEDADRLFKMIGEAYAVLSDPEKRLKYNDDEELSDILRSNSNSSNSGRPSDFDSSPYERGSWSRRQYHGSPFGRSGNRRYWQEESWRGYSNSRSRW